MKTQQPTTTEQVATAYEATKHERPALAGELSERPVTVHFMKAWPVEYLAIRDGEKPFEIRRDDRQPRFERGDVAVLQEFNPERAMYTGSGWLVFAVGYVDRSKCLPDGWCAFALDKASAKQKRCAVDAAMDGTGSK